jgi:tetratricopeptide (TPR) repeat protein
LCTLTAYAPICANGFVNYDDDEYVIDNREVQQGLGISSCIWTLTSFAAGNWHPLTWISLEADHDLYGLDPQGYHLTNLFLHTATTVMLFLTLSSMTAMLGPSAVVAACFALHPLHVESVAWIAERKDVLCAFFWVLGVSAYSRYAAEPTVLRYLVLTIVFVCGLAAKPMMVTFPCALLLLDYWPLGRLNLFGFGLQDTDKGKAWPRIVEKAPLFAIALVDVTLTLLAQYQGGAIVSINRLPLGVRLSNALAAYAIYLGHALWPIGLVAFYPHWQSWQSSVQSLVQGAALGIATILLSYYGRRRGYLITGWFWYLGTLVPTLGLVQVGLQSMADRYTYIPLIGIFIMVAWSGAEVIDHWPAASAPIVIVTFAALIAGWSLTRSQVIHWHDSIALWDQCLAITSDNPVAHNNLGRALVETGSTDLAQKHFQEAVRLRPDYPEALNNLGSLAAQRGELQEAIAHYRAAIDAQPRFAQAHVNLGNALLRVSEPQGALIQFMMALQIDPHLAEGYAGLGQAFILLGKLEDGQRALEMAIELNPANGDAHNNLALVLKRLGKNQESLGHFRRAVQLDPENAQAHFNFAALLVQVQQLNEAEKHFHKAAQLCPQDADAWQKLGLVLSMEGRDAEAAPLLKKAMSIDPKLAVLHYDLAFTLHELGQTTAADEEYRRALALDPTVATRMRQEAWRLATHPDAQVRNGKLALRLARQVCQATSNHDAQSFDTLAAALAEIGRFDDAQAATQDAISLTKRPDLIQALQLRKQLYASHRPYRDSGLAHP